MPWWGARRRQLSRRPCQRSGQSIWFGSYRVSCADGLAGWDSDAPVAADVLDAPQNFAANTFKYISDAPEIAATVPEQSATDAVVPAANQREDALQPTGQRQGRHRY